MKICLKCGREATGKGRYCSDACKQAAYRNRSVTPTVTSPTVTKPESVTVKTSAAPGPELVPDEKVYGRPAVRYDMPECWDLRPEPDSPDDVPVPGNRGRYNRLDGSGYQIDAVGTAHPIDSEAKRKNRAVLKAWAEGSGTPEQQVLVQLAMTYDVIKGPEQLLRSER